MQQLVSKCCMSQDRSSALFVTSTWRGCSGQIGDGARGARDSILDLLGLHDPAQLKLGHDGSNNQTHNSSSHHQGKPNFHSKRP